MLLAQLSRWDWYIEIESAVLANGEPGVLVSATKLGCAAILEEAPHIADVAGRVFEQALSAERRLDD